MGYRSNTPVAGRILNVNSGGDNSFSGLSPEYPVSTVNQALTNSQDINIVNPPPSALSALSISILDSDYFEDITCQDFVDVIGTGASIFSLTDSATVVEMANSMTVDMGAIINAGSNSTGVLFDGLQRARCVATTNVMGAFTGLPAASNCVGIHISGSNDDVFVDFRNGECRASNSTYLLIDGESETDPDISLGTFTNFNNDLTFVDYQPSDPLQITNLELTNFTDNSGVTGTVVFTGTSGNLVVRGSELNVPGKTIADIQSGLRLGLRYLAMSGNIVVQVGGSYLAPSIGLQAGNLDIQGDANIFQNQLLGDLTIGDSATFDGIIGTVSGTVSISQVAIDAGNVNGIINGEVYGNYANSSFALQFNDRLNLNDGAFPFVGIVQTSFDKGPILRYDSIPTDISWSEDFSNIGLFNIYADGVLWGFANKAATQTGDSPIVRFIPNSFIPAGETISVQWVGTGGGGANNRRMRNPIITVTGKRRIN